MSWLVRIENTPLGRLLEGIDPSVFSKMPRTVGLRGLQRDMSSLLGDLRGDREYRVLTNRGIPSFLLIPIDPTAWSSLLAAAPPDTEWQRKMVEKEGRETLSDLTAVLKPLEDRLR